MSYKGRPHVGNTKRNILIFRLYDTGEYSMKEIAAQVTASGKHCTEDMVTYVIRQREYYENFYSQTFHKKQSHGFPRISSLDSSG